MMFFVVVDWDTRRALKAFASEELANDWADDLLEKTGRDTLISRVTVDEREIEL